MNILNGTIFFHFNMKFVQPKKTNYVFFSCSTFRSQYISTKKLISLNDNASSHISTNVEIVQSSISHLMEELRNANCQVHVILLHKYHFISFCILLASITTHIQFCLNCFFTSNIADQFVNFDNYPVLARYLVHSIIFAL